MFLWFCVCAISHAQDVVCSAGFGSFNATFATGVIVSVGAKHSGQFAGRSCQATLHWNKQNLVVEPDAWQVDVDAVGVDLGLGSPVVAFEIKGNEVDALSKYEIWSLKGTPQRLRTITGSNFYSAADTDLDGRIEIWTNDAGAVNSFENIAFRALDFPPTVVLRFEQKRLVDVSSEFRPDFDLRITKIRARLNSQQLQEFKHSDGMLSTTTSFMPMDQLHRLITTKTRVLEVVWGYLYSDREQEAWNTLADMWPAADLDRIHAAIVKARAGGIRSQVDGVSHRSPSARFHKHVMIYDPVSEADSSQGNPLSSYYRHGLSGPTKTNPTFEVDTPPVPILLRRPPPEDPSSAALTAVAVVNLVIDCAGKVRSADMEGMPDKALLDATADWKFIPALKAGRPVASRMQLGVTPSR
jgi:hypothetical protein